MKKIIIFIILGVFLISCSPPVFKANELDRVKQIPGFKDLNVFYLNINNSFRYVVEVDTSCGNIEIEVFNKDSSASMDEIFRRIKCLNNCMNTN